MTATGKFNNVRMQIGDGEWTDIPVDVIHISGIPDVPLEISFNPLASQNFSFEFTVDPICMAHLRKVWDKFRKKAAYLRRYARGAR